MRLNVVRDLTRHDAPAHLVHRAEIHRAGCPPSSTSPVDVRHPCSRYRVRRHSSRKGPLPNIEGRSAQLGLPPHLASRRPLGESGVAHTSGAGCDRHWPRQVASVEDSLLPQLPSASCEGHRALLPSLAEAMAQQCAKCCRCSCRTRKTAERHGSHPRSPQRLPIGSPHSGAPATSWSCQPARSVAPGDAEESASAAARGKGIPSWWCPQ